MSEPGATEGSFEDFYRREYRGALTLAMGLARNAAVAEELTQDAFVAVFRDWERVRAMDNPRAWLRRVVANRSVSRYRTVVAEARALLRLHREQLVAPPDCEAGLVWSEVRRLPKRQAQAVALKYLGELTRAEIAEILDCSPETVKTHLERARRTLRARLSPLRDQPTDPEGDLDGR